MEPVDSRDGTRSARAAAATPGLPWLAGRPGRRAGRCLRPATPAPGGAPSAASCRATWTCGSGSASGSRAPSATPWPRSSAERNPAAEDHRRDPARRRPRPGEGDRRRRSRGRAGRQLHGPLPGGRVGHRGHRAGAERAHQGLADAQPERLARRAAQRRDLARQGLRRAPGVGAVGLLLEQGRCYRDAGLDPNRAPATWDELQEYTKKIYRAAARRLGRALRLPARTTATAGRRRPG